MIKRTFRFYIASVLALVAITYAPLFNGFFQQDEWQLFGYFNILLIQPELLPQFLFGPAGAHYVPLTHIVTYLLFLVFKYQYELYALTSLGFHLINTFLVIVLAYKLTKNRSVGLLAGSIFGFASSAIQAVTWTVSNISIQGAVLFALLSLILVTVFIDTQKIKYYFYCLFSLVISLLFKEVAIGLIVLIPMLGLILRKRSKCNIKSLLFPPFLIGTMYVFLRIALLLVPQFSGASTGIIMTPLSLMGNLITFPFKVLSQTMVPQFLFFDIKKIFSITTISTLPAYATTSFDQWFESRFLEALFMFIGFSLVIIFIGIYKLKRPERLRNLLVWSLCFVAVNSLIYTLAPERHGVITIIDSRNLYFPMVGSAMILSLLIALKKLTIKLKVSLLAIFILLNITYIQKELGKLNEWGETRKSILTQIKSSYPKIEDKTIFYITSDSSYYGLPKEDAIVPFQSGLGQTLLIWYSESKLFPKEFFEGSFLWDIKSQGYKEINNVGFGYFRSFDLLQESVNSNNIPINSVIAFRWSGHNNLLIDTTQEVRDTLTK